jgi:diguanylate cyclase (GGDEF)-like protein
MMVRPSPRLDVGRDVDPDLDLRTRAAALAGIGSWQCDLQAETINWTSEVYDLFALPGGRVDRRETLAMYTEESRLALDLLRTRAISQCGRFSLDARIVRGDGVMRWIRIVGGTMSQNGRALYLYGTKQDVTEERARWEDMRRLAECDALTGLSNRRMFQTAFLDCPPAAPALHPVGALLLVDVDGFKQVNDRFGHAAGDRCLRVMAERLVAAFPEALMIARIGGDEFGIVLPAGCGSLAKGGIVTAFDVLRAPILWGDQLLDVSASFGLALVHDPERLDAEATFAAADGALYEAKRAGRGMYRIAQSIPDPGPVGIWCAA